MKPEGDPVHVSRRRIAFPGLHFMSLAPLDVWARLIWRAATAPETAGIGIRHWPRLLVGLATSLYGTTVTLPERVVLWPVIRRAQSTQNGRLGHRAGAVLITGYYRSGTTHLHNLLACHPDLYTPRWGQVLAPQGFLISWGLLRVVLIAFLRTRRPQDDVSFGPAWPGEDDFALCNGALASSLTGRVTLPNDAAHWARWDSLEQLDNQERLRWQRAQFSFLWKMSALARNRRRLLIKTPAHTARVPAMAEMLETNGLGIVHIRRDPVAVVRSNVAMLRRLQATYGLQEPLPESTLIEIVMEEYAFFERRFSEARRLLPAEVRVVDVAMEDLRRTPRAELERMTSELGLAESAVFRERVGRYLSETAEYRPNTHEPWDQQVRARVEARTQELAEAHRRTRRQTVLESAAAAPSRGRIRVGLLSATGMAVVCALAWVGVALLLQNRNDWLVWPCGILIGWAGRRGAGRGTWWCGVGAFALTILVLLVVALPNTRLVYYAKLESVGWADLWTTTRQELLAGLTLLYSFMGAMSALRIAGDDGPAPPGARL